MGKKFSKKGPRKPHLVRLGGVAGEVTDLRKDVASYFEETFNDIDRGSFSTSDAAPVTLVTVDIADGAARAISVGIRGTEAGSPATHFFMHEVRFFKNTAGTIAEILPDDSSPAASKKHRENTNVDVSFDIASPGQVAIKFTGAAANDCAGIFYVEVL